MITTLSDEHGAWLIDYCSRHNLPPDRAFAEHCAALAEQQGIIDLSYTRQRAREEVQRHKWKRSQQTITGKAR